MDFRGWNRDETQCLVSIWAESSVQRKLMGSYRNRSVFEEISEKMGSRSFSRSWRQCQRKIKQLKGLYRRAKKSQSNRDRTSCVCYEELDRVLGDKPSFRCDDAACVVDFKQESTGEDEEALNSTVNTVVVKVLEPDERNFCDDHPEPRSPSASSETSMSSTQSPTSSRKQPSSSCGTQTIHSRSRLESTLEALSRSLSSSRNEEVLLKMQKAQHEHEERLFGMMMQSVTSLVSTITSTQSAPASQSWFQETDPPPAPSSVPVQQPQHQADPSDVDNPPFTVTL
uniref:Myb/SANT-like DNA-binding domain-containing protein n=1 Tax=Iconisemion striatum TaxID=60296 RepID=A0A1A7WMI7_9TELE